MKVISFLNPKGGSGKTTAVINVSTCLALSAFNVAVVDTDPQMSLANWNRAGKAKFDIFTAKSEKDVYRIRKELNKYDYVIVDGAGSLSSITSAAVMVSDLVVIPLTPSPLDFSATGAVIAVLEAQEYSRHVEARFLITRKINHTAMLKVLKESISQTEISLLKTAMTQRQCYVKSALNGDSVFSIKDKTAAGEVQILTQEIINAIE